MARIFIVKPAADQLRARTNDPLAVSTSYVIMRNGIGVLGLALPIVLIAGGGIDQVQGSLSAYYHHSPGHPAQYGNGTMRDAFVGILCAIGAFLFFYRGHSLQEDIALNIAGVAAVVIALCPMDWPIDLSRGSSVTEQVHMIFATTFFVTIAYVCVFRAGDTLCIMEDAVRRRVFRRVYVTLGIIMLATPALISILRLLARPPADSDHTTLLIEVSGVWVFASFWLIKGAEVRSIVTAHAENL